MGEEIPQNSDVQGRAESYKPAIASADSSQNKFPYKIGDKIKTWNNMDDLKRFYSRGNPTDRKFGWLRGTFQGAYTGKDPKRVQTAWVKYDAEPDELHTVPRWRIRGENESTYTSRLIGS